MKKDLSSFPPSAIGASHADYGNGNDHDIDDNGEARLTDSRRPTRSPTTFRRTIDHTGDDGTFNPWDEAELEDLLERLREWADWVEYSKRNKIVRAYFCKSELSSLYISLDRLEY